jgi:hypothetical protein
MKSTAEIEIFNKLRIQLKELLRDISELSKKKPNDAVNKFKLKLVNKVLDTANSIIDEKNKPFEDFNLFDEDDLPSNSDVVLILTQYSACLSKFREENMERVGGDWYWIINGKRSKILVD